MDPSSGENKRDMQVCLFQNSKSQGNFVALETLDPRFEATTVGQARHFKYSPEIDSG
jgi:hypothetical protein